MLEQFILEPRIAYFSMEIALANDIPTYSGGLGVLAGDTMRSATDLELPMVAVSLVSRSGYFKQEIDANGFQVEHPDAWDPASRATQLDAKIALTIEGRKVWVSAWLYELIGRPTGRQPVILLDTDLNENIEADRQITHYLYGGDISYRLKQEAVLGIGGVLMLQALGFSIRQYHMNEGHSALLAVELLRRHAYPHEDVRAGESPYDIPRVRELCNFTTHTPVEAGHDRFPYDLVWQVLGDFLDITTLKRLAGEDKLNMTRLALNMSEYVNGVAQSHAEVSRKMYPGYLVHAVTNGVHPFQWTSDSFFGLYDNHLPGWCHEPELLVRADCCISDAEIAEAHKQSKQKLIELVGRTCGIKLIPQVPVFGFARRMTAYKRPDLLFSELERLKDIHSRFPIQVVFAGKAHPHDEGGKELIRKLHHIMLQLKDQMNMAYLPDYDMDVALTMVAGVDVWLNTPMQPLEASGTSGMKAAFNGVPSLSILDGWWHEGCIEGVTGWSIGNNDETSDEVSAQSLYDKLERVVLPLYYQDQPGWVAVMKGAISKNASYFNSHRMMRRYATEAYIR